jgi:hypothetical protein
MGKLKQQQIEIEEAELKKPAPKFDRFDLEQEIIQFSMIIDDVKRVNRGVNGINNKQIDNLINYYEDKYTQLWDVFESLIHERQI